MSDTFLKRPHQIIFLNGPRKSGKDTAYKFIEREFINIRHRKFSGVLKEAILNLFAVDEQTRKDLLADGSKLKTQSMSRLLNRSFVELQIWLSEEVMKPEFGTDVFGHLMVNSLKQATGTYATVISDSRFVDEYWPVVRAFGAENCHIIRIRRNGCSFQQDRENDGDSDEAGYLFDDHYVSLGKQASIKVQDLCNDHELEMFRLQILKRVGRILNIERTYG